MKDRTETVRSIRRKSLAVLARRKRRRRLAARVGMAAAACVVLAVVVLRAAAMRRMKGECPDDGGFDSMTAGGFTEAPPRLKDAQGERRGEEIDSVYNAGYLYPDSVNLYTRPPSKERLLRAERKQDRPQIDRVNDWISGAESIAAEARSDVGSAQAVTYVVERRYGQTVTTVRVRQNQVQFGDGEWLTVSEEEAQAFRQMMRDILEA